MEPSRLLHHKINKRDVRGRISKISVLKQVVLSASHKWQSLAALSKSKSKPLAWRQIHVRSPTESTTLGNLLRCVRLVH